MALLLPACKVERTPAEYFDHRDRIATERDAARDELQDRLLALGQALNRGSTTEAMIALAPAPDASVLVPLGGQALSGATEIAAALERIASVPVAVRMSEVRVEVGPMGNVAWFHALLEVPGRGENGTPLRMTGVYVRFEGAWQLVQAHLSAPMQQPSPSPASRGEAGDSLAAE